MRAEIGLSKTWAELGGRLHTTELSAETLLVLDTPYERLETIEKYFGKN
jgi:hypothetical protein